MNMLTEISTTHHIKLTYVEAWKHSAAGN